MERELNLRQLDSQGQSYDRFIKRREQWDKTLEGLFGESLGKDGRLISKRRRNRNRIGILNSLAESNRNTYLTQLDHAKVEAQTHLDRVREYEEVIPRLKQDAELAPKGLIERREAELAALRQRRLEDSDLDYALKLLEPEVEQKPDTQKIDKNKTTGISAARPKAPARSTPPITYVVDGSGTVTFVDPAKSVLAPYTPYREQHPNAPAGNQAIAALTQANITVVPEPTKKLSKEERNAQEGEERRKLAEKIREVVVAARDTLFAKTLTQPGIVELTHGLYTGWFFVLNGSESFAYNAPAAFANGKLPYPFNYHPYFSLSPQQAGELALITSRQLYPQEAHDLHKYPHEETHPDYKTIRNIQGSAFIQYAKAFMIDFVQQSQQLLARREDESLIKLIKDKLVPLTIISDCFDRVHRQFVHNIAQELVKGSSNLTRIDADSYVVVFTDSDGPHHTTFSADTGKIDSLRRSPSKGDPHLTREELELMLNKDLSNSPRLPSHKR